MLASHLLRRVSRLPLHLHHCVSTKPDKGQNMNKLMFDSENKALIFEHFNGITYCFMSNSRE